MNGPTGKSIVRALLDPKPSRPSKRVKELWEVEAERDLLAVAHDRLLAENVRLSAELAAANIKLDELRAENASLRESADLSARQRNSMRYFA